MSKRSGFSARAVQAVAIAIAAIAATLVLIVPLNLDQQLIFGVGVIALVFILDRWKSSRFISLSLCAVSTLASTRYIIWRAGSTLEFKSAPEFILGFGLFLTEAYAWSILILGFVQTAWPMARMPEPILGGEETWPTVDILIPTYNEDLEIVRRTVFAAQAMDYPRSRFNVFLLDDGRRPDFRAFAHEAGCVYFTRKDNRHAKAGNLNEALKRTNAELVVIFDCDHVPTRAFLQATVGWFQRDKRLALLQTPHHFYSPDPVQRNLRLENQMPGESELFYGSVQKGNDLWNAAFFCGSCAVIRREALTDVGGVAPETVTEDAHTALKMQRRGWNTAYMDIRLAAGLATERLALHVGQRIRWARGMTQILRIDNPLFGPGLKLQQRLCYLNAMLHFQFPLPRIAFLTSPLAFLLFGQNVIHASAVLIFAYALPHLFATMMVNSRIQGRERGAFWGEIYEALLAFHLVLPTVLTYLDPSKGKFNVTAKGGVLERSYLDVKTLRPHIFVFCLLIIGMVVGVTKIIFHNYFKADVSTLILNLVWTSFSIFILFAAISVGKEARQLRRSVRLPYDGDATVYFEDGTVVDAAVRDISFGGIAVSIPEAFHVGDRVVTDISLVSHLGDQAFPVEMLEAAGGLLRLRFAASSPAQERALTQVIMARANVWMEKPATLKAKARWRNSVFAWATIVARSTEMLFTASSTRTQRLRPVRVSGLAAAAASLVLALVLLGAVGISAAHAADAVKRDDQAADLSDVDPRFTHLFSAPIPSGADRSRRLSLRDLHFSSKIRLAGTQGEVGVPFSLRKDEVVTGATMTLAFAHSPALLPDLSQLVVLVNGEVVQTVPLTKDNQDDSTFKFDINPALLVAGDNAINIRFLGHYARDCENPQNSALWINISNTRTWLDITSQRINAAPDLANLPAPFFDKHDENALVLPFVFTGSPGNGDLEAAAIVASWFGSQARYRGYAFKPFFNDLPSGDAVVFMTTDRRNPNVTAQFDGPRLSVVVNPKDPSGRLLLVTGRTTDELKQAATALATSGRYSSASALMEGVKTPVFDKYGAPRWLPTNRRVQLGELVDPLSLEGRGLPPGPLTARFSVAPDLFFWPAAGGKLISTYRYPKATWLDREKTHLDLSLNGQFLQTLPIDSKSLLSRFLGDTAATSAVTTTEAVLPAYALYGQNELLYYFDLALVDKGACSAQLPSDVRVSIDPRTSIDLRGAQHASLLPNLALFAQAGFPFTRYPDLADTVAIVGQSPSEPEVEAFLALMGRFGDATGAPTYRLTVARAFDAGEDAGKQILLVATTNLQGMDPLFAKAPLRLEGGRLTLVDPGVFAKTLNFLRGDKTQDQSLVSGTLVSGDSFSGLVSFPAPDGKSSVVALLASRPDLLPEAAYSIQDQRLNSEIQGDLAILVNDGYQSFNLSPKYWFGEPLLWQLIGYEVSIHPLLLVFFTSLAALIFGFFAYQMLRRLRSGRLNSATE